MAIVPVQHLRQDGIGRTLTDLSLMGEKFGPAPGNARLAQGGQQGWATNSEPRLTNGASGARLLNQGPLQAKQP